MAKQLAQEPATDKGTAGGDSVGMTNVEYISDRVNVVRCKDCMFGIMSKNCRGEDFVICENPDSPSLDQIAIMPDWFCADGERREDE